MHFANPDLLWLLVLVPVLAACRRFGRGRAAVAFPDARLFQRLPRRSAVLAETLRVGFQLGAITLLVLGLARPRWPDEGTRIPAQSRAIQIVLDISGSMAEMDFLLEGEKVSRLEAAKLAFERFVRGGTDGLPGRGDDLVGLITFAAWPEQVCPPTLSHALVLQMLADARPPDDDPRDLTTNIGDAMARGLELLRRARPAQKVMLVLSDGEHNVPPEVNPHALKPRQAAQIARGLGVRVYTVYVGPGGAAANAREAEQALRDVAELAGGRSFRARDAAALVQVCEEIDQQETSRVESFQYYRYHEAYPWFGLACLVLLVGSTGVEAVRWLRLP